MFDFHEKRKIRSIVYSKPVIGLLFLVAVFLAFSTYNRYSVAMEMKHKLEKKQEELSVLQSRAQALEAKVNYLEDTRGVEEELRNRFDVAREGEQVIVLVDRKQPQSTEAATPTPDIKVVAQEEQRWFDFLKFW